MTHPEAFLSLLIHDNKIFLASSGIDRFVLFRKEIAALVNEDSPNAAQDDIDNKNIIIKRRLESFPFTE